MIKLWARLAAAVALTWSGAAFAEDAPASCDVPPDLLVASYPVAHVRAKLATKGPLHILVIGSTSSTSLAAWAGKGVAGTGSTAKGETNKADTMFRAYPRLLQDALTARLPGMRVTVTDRAAVGLTAPMELARLDAAVRQTHPDMVVWETGTTDAVRKVDINVFGETVSEGLRRLHARGIDVVLVDIQYSPQTESIYDFPSYLDYLAQIGDACDTNILHRYDIMHFYMDSGRFDPAVTSLAAQINNARFVHGCLAEALATLIVTAAQQAP